MYLMTLVFMALLGVNSFGLLLVVLGNIVYASILPAVGFIVIFFMSPLLLMASIYQIAKKRENVVLALFGLLVSVISLMIVAGLIVALSNFT